MTLCQQLERATTQWDSNYQLLPIRSTVMPSVRLKMRWLLYSECHLKKPLIAVGAVVHYLTLIKK